MKKFQIGIVVILIIAIGFVVWYGASQVLKPNNNSLKIGVVPWIGNTVYYVGQEKGFFAKENVVVEIVNIEDYAISKQLLQTGRVDAIYLTPETAVVLNDAGVPVKVVGSSDLSYGADGIIAAQGITRVADLKGKTVAFEIGSASHFLLSYLLNKEGLSTKDLKVFESIASDAGAIFVAGKVDAAVTWEPWLSKSSERPGGHVLASSKDAEVIFDSPIFRADVVNSRRNDVAALFRGIFTAQDWIKNHEEEAAAIAANRLNITPQEAIEQMQGVRFLSYEENMTRFNSGDFSIRNSLQTAADLWLELGLIENKINADDILNDSILKDLYQ